MALVATASLAFAGVASAQEDHGEGEVTETTIGFPEGREPAVVLSEGGEVADDPAWTFRFLVPTLLALSGLVLVGLIVGYGVGVKGRYRVAR